MPKTTNPPAAKYKRQRDQERTKLREIRKRIDAATDRARKSNPQAKIGLATLENMLQGELWEIYKLAGGRTN